MAGPTAVPGVDPSGVSTPDELAACLDGLRRRRGLSYEVMERAAARLPSRSGGSRLEPLAKSTVGEIVTGKRLPTRGKLVTFLAVCEVAEADLAQWLAAWERASTADLARPVGGVRVRDARPRLLGVHAAISVPGVPDDVPPQYVLRDVDAAEFGIRARVKAAAQGGGFVLLVGGSSVGKTRCAFEAAKTLPPEWWLVHPAGPAGVAALAAAPTPRSVVWLDELQRYLDGEHGLTGATLRALLSPPHPAVIIGTLWPDRYAAYTTVPAPGGADLNAREREVLELAAVIRIDPEFSPAEQDRARTAAVRDPRLAVALEAAGYGLTQTLAAAPQLVTRWQNAKTASAYAWAVLTAALDVARLGARAPLTTDLLRAAAVDYCTSQQQAEAPDNWFEQALAYATEKLHGAAAALSPAGSGIGQIVGYAAADYLIQHASQERRSARVPASTWDALIAYTTSPDDLYRLGNAASDRGLYRYAARLFRKAVASGDPGAVRALISIAARAGDVTVHHAGLWIAGQAVLDDPRGAADALGTLCVVGANDTVAALLGRDMARRVALDNPLAVGSLLEELRRVGARDEMMVLAARAAEQIPLNHPYGIGSLLKELDRVYASDAVRVLAARAAEQIPFNDAYGVAALLDALRKVGVSDAVTVLLRRDLVRGVALDNPIGVASLLRALHEVGAGDAVTALMARATERAVVDSQPAVYCLLEALREVGASDAMTALLGRDPARQLAIASLLRDLASIGTDDDAIAAVAASSAEQSARDNVIAVAALVDALNHVRTTGVVTGQSALDDPNVAASLLRALHEVGAGDAITVLAVRAAEQVPLDNPVSVASLLDALRRVGARDEMMVLAARAAEQVPLDNPIGLIYLLTALEWADHVTGAASTVKTLLDRDPAGQVALNDPAGVAAFLDELHRLGAKNEVTALLSRDVVGQVALNDPVGVANLLWALKLRGAGDALKTLATRAASQVALDAATSLPLLRDALRQCGAADAAADLVTRAADSGVGGMLVESLSLSAAPEVVACILRFGREPDGTPSPAWRWQDLA